MGEKPLTIKEYFSFFTVNKIFNPSAGSDSSPLLVSRSKIEKGVELMGFQASSTVIQDSREGIIGSEINKYNPEKAQRRAIEIECHALSIQSGEEKKEDKAEGAGEDEKKEEKAKKVSNKKLVLKKKRR